MAVAKRRTLVANPRRKRRNAARRKLSPAQIRAGFGGKRRQSAVKRRKPKASHRKRTPKPNPVRKRVTRTRAARTRARKSSHRRSNRRASVRRNFGEIVSLLPNGPAKRRKKSMAKAKRRTKRSNASHRRTRRRNSPRRTMRRRNPMGGALGGDVISVLYMIGGGVGSKLVTQMVLSSSNTGLIGYAANLAAGGLLAWGVKSILKNASAARDVFKGAVLQVVLRAISDYTPFGQYTSQLGMGDYLASNWVTPQRYVDGLNSAQVQVPQGWGGGAVVVASSGVDANAMGAGSGSGNGMY